MEDIFPFLFYFIHSFFCTSFFFNFIHSFIFAIHFPRWWHWHRKIWWKRNMMMMMKKSFYFFSSGFILFNTQNNTIDIALHYQARETRPKPGVFKIIFVQTLIFSKIEKWLYPYFSRLSPPKIIFYSHIFHKTIIPSFSPIPSCFILFFFSFQSLFFFMSLAVFFFIYIFLVCFHFRVFFFVCFFFAPFKYAYLHYYSFLLFFYSILLLQVRQVCLPPPSYIFLSYVFILHFLASYFSTFYFYFFLNSFLCP